MGEVTKNFIYINDPTPGLGHQIEVLVPSMMSFSPHICKDTPFLDFRWSITTFVSPLSFLLLILDGLFSLILMRWRGA